MTVFTGENVEEIVDRAMRDGGFYNRAAVMDRILTGLGIDQEKHQRTLTRCREDYLERQRDEDFDCLRGMLIRFAKASARRTGHTVIITDDDIRDAVEDAIVFAEASKLDETGKIDKAMSRVDDELGYKDSHADCGLWHRFFINQHFGDEGALLRGTMMEYATAMREREASRFGSPTAV